MGTSDRWIVVGRVSRAHGIRGEVAVRSDDPRNSVLQRVKHIRFAGDESIFEIESARAARAEVLVKLAGVANRSEAEELIGRSVEAPRAALPPAEPGSFYYADLTGLLAIDESGGVLGEVRGLWETGPVPVVVIGEGKRELLVPFAEPFILRVDLAGGRLVIRPPEHGT